MDKPFKFVYVGALCVHGLCTINMIHKPLKFCIHRSIACARTVNNKIRWTSHIALFLLVLMGEMFLTNTSSTLAELEGMSSEISVSHRAPCGNKNVFALN